MIVDNIYISDIWFYNIESHFIMNFLVFCTNGLPWWFLKKPGFVMFWYHVKYVSYQCWKYWNSLFEQNINWTTIWIDQTRNLTEFNYILAEFNYKILHLILPSGRWKLSDTDLCLVCHVNDDYEHMFMSCIRVKNMWQQNKLYL